MEQSYLFDLLNNLEDAGFLISSDKKIVFKNKRFDASFCAFKSFDKFKKRFNFDANFDICFLSPGNYENKTPLDLLVNAEENSSIACLYMEESGAHKYYHIYSFKMPGMNMLKAVIFKDITSYVNERNLESGFAKQKKLYDETKAIAAKSEKLKAQAQIQMLKMGIINRISLAVRGSSSIDTVIQSAAEEIHNLSGSFKTYFACRYKNGFKIKYSVPFNSDALNNVITYEQSVMDNIKNKNITVSACLKEYSNAPDMLQKSVKRIIIPICFKNKLIGIMVSLTKQRFSETENEEVLHSAAVQLAGAVVQADLIQKLGRKNKKLKQALEKLKDTQMMLINSEKTASIGRLAAGIAHEINTPLAAINANTGISSKIINSAETINKEKLNILKELNAVNLEAVKRISGIASALKRYIRLDEAELQKADINSELDLTLKLAASEIKNNTKIIKNYGSLPAVKCHVNMVNQVFMNIIVNACQSIPSDKKDGIVRIETFSDEQGVNIKISDNGGGIAPENMNKIFLAGFTTKKAGIGAGLGLAVSKKIIEMHKGRISVFSETAKGSTFVITLPEG